MAESVPEKSQLQPKSYLVPYGHVPYSPSLPTAMGPLWDFPIEWWYYVGWAHHSDHPGSEQFTIFITLTRKEGSKADILYGIGDHSNKKFHANTISTTGDFPPPTSTSWSVKTDRTNSEGHMSCHLVSGILGLPGATYKVEMNDSSKCVSATLMLKDTFGMVLEFATNSAVSPTKSTYEFSMPSQSIQPGSSIKIGENITTLAGGNIWLDRQAVLSTSVHSPHKSILTELHSHHLGKWQKQLYKGNWLAVVMEDAVFNLAFIWPSEKQQWIVGDELNPPIPPTFKFGMKYPRLHKWNPVSPIVGVTVLDTTDFDLNIADPKDPKNSPHWTSPFSGNTYCSAWVLMLEGKHYKMDALVPGSEVGVPGYQFFDGAACIKDADDQQLRGHAFIEQMGYNN